MNDLSVAGGRGTTDSRVTYDAFAEPEQRLDAHARQELAARLADHRDRGTAVLLATHHGALTAFADRVLTLDGGVPVTAPPDQPSERGSR